MVGITSAITIEDRFSKTIGLFTKLISGSIGPVEAVTTGMSIFGKSLKDLIPFVMNLYSGFENFQGTLGFTEMAFKGIIDKAGGVEGILVKIATLFPQLQPFVGMFSEILSKLRAGEGVLSVGVGFMTQMQLPFAGIVKGIMAVRDFLNSDLARLIKAVAIGGAIVLALKGIWTGLKLLEANAPKAFGKMLGLLITARGKAINFHASMMLSDTKGARLYQKAMVGVMKMAFAFGGLRMKLMRFHASMMLSDTKAATLYQKPFQSLPKLGGVFNSAKSSLMRFHASMMLSDTKAALLYQKPFEALSKLKDTAIYKKAVTGIQTLGLGFATLRTKIFSAVGMHWILIKNLVAKRGITGGIEAYIGCLKIMTKQFAIAKLAALKTFVLMKAEAIKTFIMTTIASKGWFKTMKGGLKTIYTEAKGVFSKLPGIVKAGLAVYGIIGAVKAIKAAFTGMMNLLDDAKEKVDELITKTAGIERSKRFVMRFGEEASKQFMTMATKMSLSMGIAKSEILDASTAFRHMGVSDKTNAELTKLAARFSTLNENADFSSVANSFAEAIKSGSAEGLAEMFNGNPQALREMRRKHLDRLLDRGKVDEFLKGMNEIAEKFGYTQEKADELMNTPQGKLKRISANIDRLSGKMKSTFTTAILPYIEKFLTLIESPEFQENFEKVRRQVTGIIELFGGMVEKVVDFGIAAYRWWVEPTGGALRNIMLFLAVAGGIGKIITIFKGLAITTRFLGPAITAFGKGTKFVFNGVKAGLPYAIRGFKNLKNWLKEDQREARKLGNVISRVASKAGNAMRRIAISPGIAFTGLLLFIGKGCQALVENITGESKGVIESVVDVIVGGTVTTFGYVENAVKDTWNNIVGAVEGGINFIAEMLEGIANKMVESFFWARNQIYGLFGEEGNEIIPKVSLGRVKFDRANIMTDEEIHARAAGAVSTVMDYVPGIMKTVDSALDMMGLNSLESYAEDWKMLNDNTADKFDETNDNLRGIRRNVGDMKHKMDLQWMKELAEQRFVNRVNVRQLTPTVNVKVSGAKITAEDAADAIARELNQMADAGTFNAYGGYA